MSTTDQLEVSRSKNNSDLAFAGTMWVHLETTSTLAALVAAATISRARTICRIFCHLAEE